VKSCVVSLRVDLTEIKLLLQSNRVILCSDSIADKSDFQARAEAHHRSSVVRNS